jgi:hypothetical protein
LETVLNGDMAEIVAALTMAAQAELMDNKGE